MSYIDRDPLGIYKTSTGDTGPGPQLMGADTLIGDDVYNNDDEDLGDIKEIMLDMQSGEVAYAVLSFGGVLGMGEKLFAVPWQSLTLDTVNKRFILDIDKEQLKNAPGFDKDNWPDMSNTDWSSEIDSFYGTSSLSGARSGGVGGLSGGSGAGGSGILGT
jgi:sporulation protein YlmC with PRC-barrel domain